MNLETVLASSAALQIERPRPNVEFTRWGGWSRDA
jgi:hypothetical protein